MRAQIVSRAVLFVAAFIVIGHVAEGCGDKFVMLGRSAQVTKAKYPTSVLIFMNPSSRIPAADKEFHIEAVLKAAGHKSYVAENQSEFASALESGRYEVVLADPTDVPEIRREAKGAPGRPVVLPVLYKPSAEEVAAAEKEANCQVRPSKKSADLVVVIDETMQSRKKGAAAICETAP